MQSNTMTKADWQKLEALTWSDFAPCPFCGERKAELLLDFTHKRIYKAMNNSNYPDFFVVECVNCCARAGFDLDPYKAIKNWNNRHKT